MIPNPEEARQLAERLRSIAADLRARAEGMETAAHGLETFVERGEAVQALEEAQGDLLKWFEANRALLTGERGRAPVRGSR